MGFDIFVDKWIEISGSVFGKVLAVSLHFVESHGVMLPSLPLIARALDDMPEMWNDAGFDDALPVLVKVDSPRVARAFREDFEFVSNRVVAPDRGVDALSFFRRRAWFADVRRAEDSVASVKPTVWAPGESV